MRKKARVFECVIHCDGYNAAACDFCFEGADLIQTSDKVVIPEYSSKDALYKPLCGESNLRQHLTTSIISIVYASVDRCEDNIFFILLNHLNLLEDLVITKVSSNLFALEQIACIIPSSCVHPQICPSMEDSESWCVQFSQLLLACCYVQHVSALCSIVNYMLLGYRILGNTCVIGIDELLWSGLVVCVRNEEVIRR